MCKCNSCKGACGSNCNCSQSCSCCGQKGCCQNGSCQCKCCQKNCSCCSSGSCECSSCKECSSKEEGSGCCGSKKCNEAFSGTLLELADQAWMEVLKDKIKDHIVAHQNERLEELAKIVSETNNMRWKNKMEKKQGCKDFCDKICHFFGLGKHKD